jgi:hypothetical protein
MQGLIFHEHWWLAAASGERVTEATVEQGGRLVGRLPYVCRKRLGFRLIGMPALTHVLGPLVDAGRGKPETQLRTQLTIVRELLEQLPPFDRFMQACESSTALVLAFQQCGFAVKPQCNFRLDCRARLPDLLGLMNFKTRGHIHRAEKDYAVAPVNDPYSFMTFYRSNMAKAKRTDTVELERLPTLLQACREHDAGEIIAVQDREGNPLAMAFLVWDSTALYYLLATRTPDSSSANAANLLVWAAIQRAHERGLSFDFDGIVHAGQMRFFLGFGAQLCSRLIVTRTRALYGAARFVRLQMAPARTRESAIFT